MWRSSALGHRAGGRWMSAYHVAFFFRLESIVYVQVNSNITFLVFKLYSPPPDHIGGFGCEFDGDSKLGVTCHHSQNGWVKRKRFLSTTYPQNGSGMRLNLTYILQELCCVLSFHENSMYMFSCWPSLERWFSIARWKDGKSLRLCPDMTNYYRTVYILFQNVTGRYCPYMREIIALFQWLVVFHWPVEHCSTVNPTFVGHYLRIS
jgi:hypothetical protein